MMLSPRILVSSFGLLLGNLLILNGLVPSNVTLCVLFLTLFCISFFLRVFYKGFIHFWGESFYQIVLVLLLFSSTLIIAYGRIGLNAHLTHCFATVFAAGMVGPANGLITQMMPSGSENYANSGGSWREYLNLSPEQGEGGGILINRLIRLINRLIRLINRLINRLSTRTIRGNLEEAITGGFVNSALITSRQ